MNVLSKIVVAVMSGIGLTIILLLISNNPNKSNNGFDRYFLPIEPEILNRMNFNFLTRDIIYLDKEDVFISTDSPDIVLSYTYTSNQIKYRKLKVSHDIKARIGNVYSINYDPKNGDLMLFANNLRGVLTINRESFPFTSLGDKAYSYAIRISENSYILRRFEGKSGDAIFERISIPSGTRLGEKNVSLKSTDGGLSTDGHLLYNKKNSLLTYMHYYNNEILSFDTTLKLIKRFQTIDTISYKEQLDRTKPLLVTNKKSAVYGDYIFICSNLKADNESKRDYDKNIPIDIYNVVTGTYKGSIYVPVSNQKLISSLIYDGEILAALYYDNSLILFQLPIEELEL